MKMITTQGGELIINETEEALTITLGNNQGLSGAMHVITSETHPHIFMPKPKTIDIGENDEK